MRSKTEVFTTLSSLFWTRVEQRGDRVAMREKKLGIWRSISWTDFGESSRAVGLGMVSLGVELGDKICVMSNNNPEWFYADMGALGIGAVSAGIYPTDASSQVEHLINDCGATVVFVEDDEQLDKVLHVRENTPSLIKIVVFDTDNLHSFEDPMVLSMEDLVTLGNCYHLDHPDAWQKHVLHTTANDLAILVYTSGTTGPPKGAMLSHRNIIESVKNMPDFLPLGENDEALSFLPLCHVAERVLGFYTAVYHGVVVNFAESPETVPENIREVQPTAFFAVPRVWEKFYSSITIAMSEATPIARWAYKVALRVGERVASYRLEAMAVPTFTKIQFWLSYHLVLRNVRRMMGLDRCRWLGTGAAPIAPDLIRWYWALGFTMLEGYGMTECSGLATMMPFERVKLGTTGLAVPFVELKISSEGEILLRGENVFMGYHNQPDKTAESIRDGWLRTGDIGFVDNEGFVKITDRMKDIIITAGGKNITPSEIENQLKFSPYISDAVVVGDQRKFLSCLIMIDEDNVVKFAQDHDVPFTNFASLTRSEDVIELIEKEVKGVNEKFARVESIKTFRLIEQQLDPEDEELTPTMKLKRQLVNVKYKNLIDDMYAAA